VRARAVSRWVGAAAALAWVAATAWSAGAPPSAGAEADAPGAAEAVSPDHLPRSLRISLVHSGPAVATLQERIASWFPATTEVAFSEQADIDRAQMLSAPNEGEVRLWILKLSEQRAVVVFAVADEAASTKHLVRDVELRSGLDELGLERLAFVVHSAVVALGEGSAATPREDVERLLDSEAVARLPTVSVASSHPDAAVGTAAASAASPVPAVSVPVVPPSSGVPPSTSAPALSPATPPVVPTPLPVTPSEGVDSMPAGASAEPALQVALAAGYGVRFRGPEGTGHGPVAEISAAWPRGANVFAALAGGQLFLPSTFEADGREVGLEVVHLYLGAAWDRRISEGWSSDVAGGFGVDLVRIQPPPADGDSFAPRPEGKQQRPTAEASLGLWYANQVLAIGLFVQTIFVLNEVEYRIATESDERSVLSARRVQPGLALRLRFPGQG